MEYIEFTQSIDFTTVHCNLSSGGIIVQSGDKEIKSPKDQLKDNDYMGRSLFIRFLQPYTVLEKIYTVLYRVCELKIVNEEH